MLSAGADTLGNLNFTKVFFTKDSIKPSFLNITENPSNASIYVAGRTYNFNITINESNIYSYGIDFNGTNYSVANNSNVYIFNISNLFLQLGVSDLLFLFLLSP